MKLHRLSALGASAILFTALSFTQGVAQAVSLSDMPNSTRTVFDANSGQISFSWNKNSPFEITGTDVHLESDEIGGGMLYEFVIPNFYDPLPQKIIHVVMEGANAGTGPDELPRVLDIIGADSDFIKGGPAVPVVGVFDSGRPSPTLVEENWLMFPNPDFEIVKIFAPFEFELQSISIETVSTVPVPAAVWLFGSGLVGLIGIAKRRKA